MSQTSKAAREVALSNRIWKRIIAQHVLVLDSSVVREVLARPLPGNHRLASSERSGSAHLSFSARSSSAPGGGNSPESLDSTTTGAAAPHIDSQHAEQLPGDDEEWQPSPLPTRYFYNKYNEVAMANFKVRRAAKQDAEAMGHIQLAHAVSWRLACCVDFVLHFLGQIGPGTGCLLSVILLCSRMDKSFGSLDVDMYGTSVDLSWAVALAPFILGNILAALSWVLAVGMRYGCASDETSVAAVVHSARRKGLCNAMCCWNFDSIGFNAYATVVNEIDDGNLLGSSRFATLRNLSWITRPCASFLILCIPVGLIMTAVLMAVKLAQDGFDFYSDEAAPPASIRADPNSGILWSVAIVPVLLLLACCLPCAVLCSGVDESKEAAAAVCAACSLPLALPLALWCASADGLEDIDGYLAAIPMFIPLGMAVCGVFIAAGIHISDAWNLTEGILESCGGGCAGLIAIGFFTIQVVMWADIGTHGKPTIAESYMESNIPLIILLSGWAGSSFALTMSTWSQRARSVTPPYTGIGWTNAREAKKRCYCDVYTHKDTPANKFLVSVREWLQKRQDESQQSPGLLRLDESACADLLHAAERQAAAAKLVSQGRNAGGMPEQAQHDVDEDHDHPPVMMRRGRRRPGRRRRGNNTQFAARELVQQLDDGGGRAVAVQRRVTATQIQARQAQAARLDREDVLEDVQAAVQRLSEEMQQMNRVLSDLEHGM